MTQRSKRRIFLGVLTFLALTVAVSGVLWIRHIEARDNVTRQALATQKRIRLLNDWKLDLAHLTGTERPDVGSGCEFIKRWAAGDSLMGLPSQFEQEQITYEEIGTTRKAVEEEFHKQSVRTSDQLIGFIMAPGTGPLCAWWWAGDFRDPFVAADRLAVVWQQSKNVEEEFAARGITRNTLRTELFKAASAEIPALRKRLSSPDKIEVLLAKLRIEFFVADYKFSPERLGLTREDLVRYIGFREEQSATHKL